MVHDNHQNGDGPHAVKNIQGLIGVVRFREVPEILPGGKTKIQLRRQRSWKNIKL